jgi:hypothetical protein
MTPSVPTQNAQRNIRRRQATIIQKCQELSQLGVQVFLVMRIRDRARLLNTNPRNVLFQAWDREMVRLSPPQIATTLIPCQDRGNARVIRVRSQPGLSSRPPRLIDRLEPSVSARLHRLHGT